MFLIYFFFNSFLFFFLSLLVSSRLLCWRPLPSAFPVFFLTFETCTRTCVHPSQHYLRPTYNGVTFQGPFFFFLYFFEDFLNIYDVNCYYAEFSQKEFCFLVLFCFVFLVFWFFEKCLNLTVDGS